MRYECSDSALYTFGAMPMSSPIPRRLAPGMRFSFRKGHQVFDMSHATVGARVFSLQRLFGAWLINLLLAS